VAHLPELAPEPRRTRGGAGGAGRGQWVQYPLRVVVDAESYADADTKVYGKVKALSKNRSCEASVEKLAAYCGLAASTVQKSLRRLSRPAPTDGIEELTRKQRSHKGTGNGRTAERTCRTLETDERYVSAPVLAADTLRGTLHRLYLFLRYTEIVEKRQLTLAEMAWVLRHHSGQTRGQALAEAVVSKLLDELADLGWITLDRRAGYRGRHLITVHDHPVRAVDEPDATPDPEGGVAPDLEGGPLAYKEDQALNDPRRSTDRRGSFRRRRGTGSYRPDPVDNSAAPSVAPATFRSAARQPVRPQDGRTYDGPPQTLSERLWWALEPVRDLLPEVRPFVMRRIGREVGRQLDTGIWAEDIRDQLARMRRWTPPEEITDPGRWILGAVLPVRPGRCGTADCHYGVQRYTGAPCKACAELEADRARANHPPHTAAWHECAHCRAPSRTPLPAGLCRTCA